MITDNADDYSDTTNFLALGVGIGYELLAKVTISNGIKLLRYLPLYELVFVV